jgi:hypothetical protein
LLEKGSLEQGLSGMAVRREKWKVGWGRPPAPTVEEVEVGAPPTVSTSLGGMLSSITTTMFSSPAISALSSGAPEIVAVQLIVYAW